MPMESAVEAADLHPDQLRLLGELALFGGEKIVRHRREHSHYGILEKKRLIKATPLSIHEVRYNMTAHGRSVLSANPK